MESKSQCDFIVFEQYKERAMHAEACAKNAQIELNYVKHENEKLKLKIEELRMIAKKCGDFSERYSNYALLNDMPVEAHEANQASDLAKSC